MDDPWGSPWAEESPYLSQKVDKLVSRKSVTSERDLGISQDSRSPWNDDDEYGEWAALPATDERQVDLRDGPEQAESVESDAPVSVESTQGTEHIRADGSSWFTREMSSGNMGSLIVDKSQIEDRALSPDPWARGAAIPDEKARPDFAADANSDFQVSEGDADKEVARVRVATENNAEEFNRTDHGEHDKPLPPSSTEDVPPTEPVIRQDHGVTTTARRHGDIVAETGEVTQGEFSASRPSSSPSDNSHHDEVLAESPRTSFEEAEERPKLGREGSSKVKEMVRLFDGLAVDQSVSDLPGQERVGTPEDQSGTPQAAQSEDDFGEFEEGSSDMTAKVVQREAVLAVVEVAPVAKPDAQDDTALYVSPEQAVTSSSDQPAVPYEPVHFEPNLTLLSQVFDSTVNTETVHADPMLDSEIEAFFADSLSSIQERKTWYRISRYGTMRKHNTGDEDSYVRINWKDSEVRVETLKTVERWIEEDRLGGGVILGGGTRLGSMFGWGQKNAAPISVAAALASRNNKAAVRPDHVEPTMSTMGPNAGPLPANASSQRPPEQISISRRKFSSPLSATAPQFTWSTGTPISSNGESKLPSLPAPVNPNNSGHNFGASTPSLKPVSDTSSRISIATTAAPSAHKLIPPPSPNIVAPNIKKLGHQFGNMDVNESFVQDVRHEMEDEWGEMVSFPSLENQPPLVEPVNAQTHPITSGIPTPVLVADPSAIILGEITDRCSSKQVIASLPPTENPVSSDMNSPAIKLNYISSTVPKSDPWQTADFSFFDDPVDLRPKAAPPSMDPNDLHRPSVPVRKGIGFPSGQTEQDRVVKGIVQNLPNLSYMLRR